MLINTTDLCSQVKSKKKEHQSYFDMLRKYLPLWMQYVINGYVHIPCDLGMFQ